MTEHLFFAWDEHVRGRCVNLYDFLLGGGRVGLDIRQKPHPAPFCELPTGLQSILVSPELWALADQLSVSLLELRWGKKTFF